jgi:hypothetical protein
VARNYAQIATEIWRDEDFVVLSEVAQHKYLLLITQPDISAAGVLSLALARWASRSKGATRASVRDAIEELEAHRYVVFDEETEELLVRGFVRWDGGYKNEKRRFAIRDAARQIVSPVLRRALAAEFGRLDLPADWIPAFPQVDSPSDRASDAPSDGASRSRRVVVTTSSTTEATTHNTQHTTPVPSAQPSPPASGRRRGTRIPDDFAVTQEMVAWARDRVPDVDGRHETEKFLNHWRAKSGKDATKVDWVLTWKNWMLRASESSARKPARLTTDDRVAQAVAAGDRLQAQYDRQELTA